MATSERRTRDGFELQLGTNLLGHFALTCLLSSQRSPDVTVAAGLWTASEHLTGTTSTF